MSAHPECEWRPVRDFPGYYVSDTGLVYSSRRDRVMSPGWQYGGYLFVALRRDGRTFNKKVHALVAEAFIGPRPDGFVVNHIDANKRNNRASNLEYLTPGDNVRHAAALGLMSKLSDNEVACIRYCYSRGESQTSIAKRYGVTQSYVSQLVLYKARVS